MYNYNMTQIGFCVISLYEFQTSLNVKANFLMHPRARFKGWLFKTKHEYFIFDYSLFISLNKAYFHAYFLPI